MSNFAVHNDSADYTAVQIAASILLRRLKTFDYQPLVAIDDKLPLEELVAAIKASGEYNQVLNSCMFCPTHDLELEDPVAGSLESRWMLTLASAGLVFPQKLYALPLVAREGKKPKVKCALNRLPADRRPDVVLGLVSYGTHFNGAKNPGTFAGVSHGIEILDEAMAINYNHGTGYKPSRAWSRRSITRASLVIGMVLTEQAVDAAIAIPDDSEGPLHYLSEAATTEIIVRH